MATLRYFRVSLLLALSLSACAGKSVNLDEGPGSGQSDPADGSPVTVVRTRDAILMGRIAVDSQRLYWSTFVVGSTLAELNSCLKDDCARTKVVYTSRTGASFNILFDFQVQDESIYWAKEKPGDTVYNDLVACPVTGCVEPQLIALNITNFRVDENEVFFARPETGNRILACPRSGCAGPPRELPEWKAENAELAQVFAAVGPDSLFESSVSGELLRLPKDGSSAPELLATSLAIMGGVAADSSHVYWATPLLAGSINRCAYPGCPGGPEVVAPSVRRASLIAIQRESAFFMQQSETGDSQLVSCPLEDCSTPHTIATVPGNSTGGVAVDDTHAYVFLKVTVPGRSWFYNVQRYRL